MTVEEFMASLPEGYYAQALNWNGHTVILASYAPWDTDWYDRGQGAPPLPGVTYLGLYDSYWYVDVTNPAFDGARTQYCLWFDGNSYTDSGGFYSFNNLVFDTDYDPNAISFTEMPNGEGTTSPIPDHMKFIAEGSASVMGYMSYPPSTPALTAKIYTFELDENSPVPTMWNVYCVAKGSSSQFTFEIQTELIDLLGNSNWVACGTLTTNPYVDWYSASGASLPSTLLFKFGPKVRVICRNSQVTDAVATDIWINISRTFGSV